MITIEDIKTLFDDLRADSEWNVDGPLTWGYYFTDTDSERLQPLSEHLCGNGYRFVELYATEDSRRYFLHLERVERLRPETVLNRHKSMEEKAAEFGVEAFDGLDVDGPPPAKD